MAQISFINNTLQKIRLTVLTALGYVPENVANKTTSLIGDSDIKYPTQKAVKDALDLKQNLLSYDSVIGSFILLPEDFES